MAEAARRPVDGVAPSSPPSRRGDAGRSYSGRVARSIYAASRRVADGASSVRRTPFLRRGREAITSHCRRIPRPVVALNSDASRRQRTAAGRRRPACKPLDHRFGALFRGRRRPQNVHSDVAVAEGLGGALRNESRAHRSRSRRRKRTLEPIHPDAEGKFLTRAYNGSGEKRSVRRRRVTFPKTINEARVHEARRLS